jgi:acyl-CoA synthetase (AMP-forming)/AMP-acid ligase II
VLADEADGGHWLRTGDLGFLGPQGLFVTGRAKEIIVIRGANFDPLDIEAAAQESSDALATGAGSAFSVEAEGGEAVVLACEVERSALRGLDANAVAGAVVEAVSRRFSVNLYDLVLLRPGALPRTTSGKIRRSACRQQYLAGELDALPGVESPILGRARRSAHSFS